MEQEYVIGVRNKFAGFLEEGEDPYDILKNVEAENKKKKALKVSISNENKENKSKDANEVKSKAVKKPAANKATDRVLSGTGDRGAKPDAAPPADRPRRNKEESGEFPRTGSFRDGNKPDAPRGPRNDNREGPRGERRDRDGPRPFRDERERRGPRPDGDRPFRQRDGAGSDGEGRPPRRERRDFGPETLDSEGRPERRTGGPRGRGSRPPGRNFEGRGGKREFDRRSGSDRTGVKPVDKRDGAGSYNWDSTKDTEAMIPDLNETNTSDEPDWNNTITDADAAPAPAPKDTEDNEEPAAPVEEEPQELTLDEYRKLRGARERPQFDIRKPGEGEDLSQWKNMIEMKKKENEEEEEEFEIADCPQRAGRQKHVVGIDITFNDVFRGGRGRGRGRGGRENRDREPREFREPREPREFREPREPREFREPREPREPRDFREPREPREFREPREPREFREPREPREPREFREPREPREFREPREPREPRVDRGEGPPQRRFPPRDRDDRRDDRRDRVYEDRSSRPSAPKVDDEKAFPSLG